MDSLAEEFALMTVGKFRARYRAISGTSDIHVPRYFAPGGYSKKLLSIAPANLLAYWPMWETAGAVADNLEGTAARDGAYTGVTLADSTGPDGKPVPLFDGTNDFNNIYTANFSGAFNGAEGSFALWVKVSAAGVWTDGASRNMITIAADANNFARVNRRTAANEIQFSRSGAGTNETVNVAGLSTTSWFHIALTWSEAAGADGQLKAYYNGSQTGATQTALGTFANSPFTTTTVVGAATTVPAAVWSGWLAHAAVWTTPLTATQILALATV